MTEAFPILKNKKENHLFNKYTVIHLILCHLLLSGCSHTAEQASTSINGQSTPIPTQPNHSAIEQIAKTDLDRLADIELRENNLSLRTIMLKLYKRNPNELKKSNGTSPEKMVAYLFEQSEQHHFNFHALNNLKSTKALFLAFDPQFEGDRVFAFIVGLHTMILKAHGGINDFYITDSLNPQTIYNAARNIEIATWKLSNATDPQGKLYLISNTLNAHEKNISIEREFGKIIGRTDLFAITASEKSQRTITRMIQNIASAFFLPI